MAHRKPGPAVGAPLERRSLLAEGGISARPAHDAARAANDRLHELAERMRAMPATTVAGFAAKAKTLRFDLCKSGDAPEPMSEWDWDAECLERFIRDIEAAGGGLV